MWLNSFCMYSIREKCIILLKFKKNEINFHLSIGECKYLINKIPTKACIFIERPYYE